jgi:hypothetical protein
MIAPSTNSALHYWIRPLILQHFAAGRTKDFSQDSWKVMCGFNVVCLDLVCFELTNSALSML